MSPSPDAAAPRGRRGADTRKRIVDAATELFYAQGIRATSAERVVERVGITKVTFYRYFPSKSDLVVAYLERQVDTDRRTLTAAQRDPDPLDGVRHIAQTVGAAVCRDGFRGCPFLNAAVEFPDAEDPARRVVDAHRRWTLEVYSGLAASAGAPDPGLVAVQLLMLRDGAMLAGYLGAGEIVGPTLTAACLRAIRTARPATA